MLTTERERRKRGFVNYNLEILVKKTKRKSKGKIVIMQYNWLFNKQQENIKKIEDHKIRNRETVLFHEVD